MKFFWKALSVGIGMLRSRSRFCRWKYRHPASIGFRWHGTLYYLGLQGSRWFIRHAVKPLILAEKLQLNLIDIKNPERGLETKAGLILKMKY